MTEEGIDMKLDNGIGIFGKYCQRSNLPLVPMAQVKQKLSFWTEAFSFTVDNLCQMKIFWGTTTQIYLLLKRNCCCGTNVFPMPQLDRCNLQLERNSG
jgi:hypothetical protein